MAALSSVLCHSFLIPHECISALLSLQSFGGKKFNILYNMGYINRKEPFNSYRINGGIYTCWILD